MLIIPLTKKISWRNPPIITISIILFNCLVYMDSTLPLVGASGSIAGLIGAYAVLFSKKKIKILFSSGFNFNYLRIPAIILLPIWIGSEFYQLYFGGDSHVAYTAHIGGLLCGAVFGIICIKFLSGFDEDGINEASIDEMSPLMETALKHVGEPDKRISHFSPLE
jgi:membrane associated rhomboid family serine protease